MFPPFTFETISSLHLRKKMELSENEEEEMARGGGRRGGGGGGGVDRRGKRLSLYCSQL